MADRVTDRQVALLAASIAATGKERKDVLDLANAFVLWLDWPPSEGKARRG